MAGVKIVFRVGLVLLKQMLGSVEKLREVQGMYETMERLRNISPDTIREDVLVQEVRPLFFFFPKIVSHVFPVLFTSSILFRSSRSP